MPARTPQVLKLGGLLALLVAVLSLVDMFMPRAYDGVVLEADAPGRLIVREVVAGSGAQAAGIEPGEIIVGIDRTILESPGHAAELLNRRRIGQTVPYFVRGPAGLREVLVALGPRRIGSLPYLYACLLGFAFFFIGWFVLGRQPQLRPAQVFFLLGTLFLLFLVCRLRPASYSWIDSFVLTTGMAALLFLPACFLHFFLIFPSPVRLRPPPEAPRYRPRRLRWLALLAAVYLLPAAVLATTVGLASQRGRELRLISGAPLANWWMLAAYILVGLSVLAWNAYRLEDRRQRMGAALVFFGSFFGLLPFLVTAVAFPSFLHTEKFLFLGVAPLALVPLTFAWAIVRFQLLEIRVILRKSLLYTVTTAVVTALYALAIALFNAFSSGTGLAASRFFPLLFALAIVLLFDPLRGRIQVVVDRFFLAGRTQLEEAIRQLGDAFFEQTDLQQVVRKLVDRLPRVLGLHYAALYLARSDDVERVAGPTTLPERLPLLEGVPEELVRRRGLAPLERLRRAAAGDPQAERLADRLAAAGVELIGDLVTPRRRVGTVLLSHKAGQLSYDRAELELLRNLLQQAAIALETSLLLDERTRQAELERELEIAARVQAELLSPTLSLAPGWSVAAVCRPARHVGGDFYTELPGPRGGASALVYGDVAGKSVSGALMMMAAHEALHSLALSHPDPEQLLALANRRLYGLGRRKSFVALAYLAAAPDGEGLDYMLAGQPQPLVRRLSGAVEELPLPANRMPLGALESGDYRLHHLPLAAGDAVLGYSDGVVDARSPSGESFGAERLARVVGAAPAGAAAMVDHVLGALSRFTLGVEPYDDLTLVAIHRDREDRS